MLKLLTRGVLKAVLPALICSALLTASAFAEQDKGWDKPVPLCWTIDPETIWTIPPVSDRSGILFLALADGSVAAIDGASGKQAWHTSLGGEIKTMKLAENGRVITVTGQENDKNDKPQLVVSALSEDSGVTVWRKEIDPVENFYLLVRGSSVFLAREDGQIIALNAGDGSVLWQANTGKNLPIPPVFSDKAILAGLADKQIVEISLETGKITQTYSLQTEPSGQIVAAKGLIVYSDQLGNIFAIRQGDGMAVWKARAGAEVADLTVTIDGILVSSNDNFVYMLTANRGDRKWKRKFSGRLSSKPVLQDNFGLFATVSGTEAIVLDLANGKVINGISLMDEAYFTGSSAELLDGFVLSTSRGLSYYTGICKKK